MHEPGARSFRIGGLSPQPLPVDEINARYHGQWVLLKVTAFDERRTPSEGRVIAYGTRKRVYKVLSSLVATQGKPDMPYYIFSAGSFVRLGSTPSQIVEPTPPEGYEGAGQ